MKNRSQKYNINRPRSRHGHNYTKYKMYLSIMMVLCIKQYLSKLWSSIHGKVKKQHWDWVEKNVTYELKKRLLMKKACNTIKYYCAPCLFWKSY